MKIADLTVLDDGMPAEEAERFWDDVEGFASYSFNKSHSVAYSLISYLSMWTKVHHPSAFFCGALSTVKEDRNAVVLADMRRLGIELRTPDINLSGMEFEPLHETALIMPFSAIKGVSDNTARAILEAREAQPRRQFADVTGFEAAVEKRRCNSRHRELLDRVGAFARIAPDLPAHDDPCRKPDQLALLPGLIEGGIIGEPMDTGDGALERLVGVINGWRTCEDCELSKACHPMPGMSKANRLMVIVDGPNWKEEASDEMGNGPYMEAVEQAMAAAGLSLDDAYMTAFVKAPKPGKAGWSNKTIAACAQWSEREIAALKPPVVVLCGSLATRHYLPDLRFGETGGRVVWDAKRGVNFVVGVNPAAIHFDEAKRPVLERAFAEAAALLPY